MRHPAPRRWLGRTGVLLLGTELHGCAEEAFRRLAQKYRGRRPGLNSLGCPAGRLAQKYWGTPDRCLNSLDGPRPLALP